jgi:transposase
VDALGDPVRVRLTPGQRHEMTRAEALVDGLPAGWLIADTAFDADGFRRKLSEAGTTAVIPPNPPRARAVRYDRDLYKERHVVECFFAKLEQFRRIATRYEKLKATYLGLLHLVLGFIRLRRQINVNTT